MRKPVIAVDCDDVVLSFNWAFISHHNQHYGTNLSYEGAYTFDMPKLYGLDQATVEHRVRNFCHNHHDDMMPLFGAGEALAELNQRCELHLVTSRCESLREQTQRALARWSLEYFTELHFTNGFGSIYTNRRSKLEVCREIGAQVLLEDGPPNAIEVGNGGVPVLLFDHPWNKEVEHFNVTRMHPCSWERAVEWITYNL